MNGQDGILLGNFKLEMELSRYIQEHFTNPPFCDTGITPIIAYTLKQTEEMEVAIRYAHKVCSTLKVKANGDPEGADKQEKFVCEGIKEFNRYFRNKNSFEQPEFNRATRISRRR